jgi:hypothetical protein
MARRLFLDTESGRFVQGLNSSIPASIDNLFENDSADYELYFLQRDPTGVTAYEARDFGAKSIKLHIGNPPPSTATAFVAQNVWTNLPSTCTASITRTATGGTTANEQQRLTFAPEAQSGTFTLTVPSRQISVSAIAAGVFTTSGSHGLAALEPFTITGLSSPTGGLANGQSLFVAQVRNTEQFTSATTITTTAVTAFAASAGAVSTLAATTRLLSARATALDVQNALAELTPVGANNVIVLGVPGIEYRAAFQNTRGQVALPLMTVNAQLVPAFGKFATINFSTTELQNAISASASIAAVLEVESTEGGAVETLCQVPVTIFNDIISATSPTPVLVGSTSFALLAPDNSQWVVSIDNDGVLTATKTP